MSDRLRSLKEDSSNSKEGKRRLNNEVLLDNYLKIGSRASNMVQLQHWVEFRASTAKVKLKKRDLKLYQKEAIVLNKYLQGVRPRVIAHEIQVLRSFINRSYIKYSKKIHDFGQWL